MRSTVHSLVKKMIRFFLSLLWLSIFQMIFPYAPLISHEVVVFLVINDQPSEQERFFDNLTCYNLSVMQSNSEINLFAKVIIVLFVQLLLTLCALLCGIRQNKYIFLDINIKWQYYSVFSQDTDTDGSV